MRDDDHVYELPDDRLTVAQLARKMIAAWSDGHGSWDAAMAAGISSVDPAPVVRDHFDGTCRRCGGGCVEVQAAADLWVCLGCDARVELLDGHHLA